MIKSCMFILVIYVLLLALIIQPTDGLTQVKLESNFASIVFAIMVLEGLGRSLDPNLDILDLAKPLLLKNCTSLL